MRNETVRENPWRRRVGDALKKATGRRLLAVTWNSATRFDGLHACSAPVRPGSRRLLIPSVPDTVDAAEWAGPGRPRCLINPCGMGFDEITAL